MDGLLAKSVEITRADETIGIQLEVEVTCDDLKGLEPGEALLVVGVLEPEGADRIRLALARALTDASNRRQNDGELAHLHDQGRGVRPAGEST